MKRIYPRKTFERRENLNYEKLEYRVSTLETKIGITPKGDLAFGEV